MYLKALDNFLTLKKPLLSFNFRFLQLVSDSSAISHRMIFQLRAVTNTGTADSRELK
jgi:hypothetical protein